MQRRQARRRAGRRGARGSRSRRGGRSRRRDRPAAGPAMRRSRVVLAITDAAAMRRCAVAVHHGAVRRRRGAEPEAVDQADLRAGVERRQGLRQQAQVGPVQPVAVDGRRAGRPAPRPGRLARRPRRPGARGPPAVSRLESSRSDSARRARRLIAAHVEADSGDHQRPGQGAAPGLVGPGHARHAEGPVMGEQPRGDAARAQRASPGGRGPARRRLGAGGRPLTLADARPFLPPCRAGSRASRGLTSPSITRSMRSILGECTGKVRSTPTPKLCLRTVKVSREVEPWRLMTLPRRPARAGGCPRSRGSGR